LKDKGWGTVGEERKDEVAWPIGIFDHQYVFHTPGNDKGWKDELRFHAYQKCREFPYKTKIGRHSYVA
jgi:hypothetical protein